MNVPVYYKMDRIVMGCMKCQLSQSTRGIVFYLFRVDQGVKLNTSDVSIVGTVACTSFFIIALRYAEIDSVYAFFVCFLCVNVVCFCRVFYALYEFWRGEV